MPHKAYHSIHYSPCSARISLVLIGWQNHKIPYFINILPPGTLKLSHSWTAGLVREIQWCACVGYSPPAKHDPQRFYKSSLPQATLINSNHAWPCIKVPCCCILDWCQNLRQNAPPWLQGCRHLLRSHGCHVMIMQPCVTHATLAGHLTGRPGTWGSQPSFLPIYFYLIAC